MRPEIAQALEQAEAELQKTEQWLKEQGLWPVRMSPSGELAPDGYSHLLTDQQYANQERVQWLQHRLRKCLLQKKYLGARDIYSLKPSSLTLEWGELETEVEIEISRYGNLAAVHVYGDIALSRAANKDIQDCLEFCKLTRISDEEIEDLQDQGVYYLIF